MKPLIVIVDYGMGNLRSVHKAIKRIGAEVEISNEPSTIQASAKLILPGVGHFATGMKNIISSGLAEVLKNEVMINKKPILGICLGMQLMTRFSEEGNVDGLNFIDAVTLKFPVEKTGYKIPHMGWNEIIPVKTHGSNNYRETKPVMYFVHSYYVKCHDDSDILYQTEYITLFDSGFEHENIMGFQFHPEKSHNDGLRLISDFINK